MSAATWRDALLGAALLAVDPAGLGGAILRARHGPGRERWLATLGALLPEARPLRRLPPGADAGRLLGGLDLTATLAAGRRRAERGLLAEADGGVVVLPMAERAEAGLVGCLCRVLDTGEARAERDGLSLVSPARIAVVALDEGAEAEERIPGPLADRLALHLDLTALSARDAPAAPVSREDVLAARSALASRPADDALCAALVGAAAALGIGSLRAPLLALATARAATALFDGRLSTEAAAEIAGRLVLAPRAVCLPAPPDPEPDPETAPEPPAEAEREPADAPGESTGALADRVLDAVRAALPPDLLAAQAAQAARTEARLGRAGEERRALDRGRPVGSRPGRPRGGARLDLLGTLTAAAPWQPLRRRPGDAAAGVRIAADDLRIRRLKRRSATASIFVVDASGSAAAARLAEAKGEIERLLAEAYIRRDQVALVAFRGQ